MGANMGTTLVLLFSQGSLYNLFWAGDSRAYLMGDSLSQLTVDHSLVQALIDRGELTEAQAETDPRKNAVTRALGVQELDTVRADSISDKWKPNQKILLCSDGLSDLINLSEIEKVLVKKISNQEMVNELIVKALAAGGKDNITVVIVSAPNQPNQVDQDTYVPDDITDNTKVRDDDETKSTDN
jgi:serine/threonine protein phosphatase PrpC